MKPRAASPCIKARGGRIRKPGKMAGTCPRCRHVAPDFLRRRKTANIHPIRESSAESQLMAVGYDVVLPFDRDKEGALNLGEPKGAPDAGSAERRWGVSHHKWSRTMTFSRIALFAAAAVAMAPGVGPAFAADDAARIKQCVADNQGEGQTAAVVAAYCDCMSKRMSASETQSITTWENSHPNDQGNCSVEAGAKKTK
jgi:hypothetical protein